MSLKHRVAAIEPRLRFLLHGGSCPSRSTGQLIMFIDTLDTDARLLIAPPQVLR
jgi:hypothetical protein